MVTRATTGTYTDKNGYLATASINAPRYNYTSPTTASLLMESASTNYLYIRITFRPCHGRVSSGPLPPPRPRGPDNTFASGTKIEINDTTRSGKLNQIIGSSAGYVASIWIKGRTTTNVSVGMYDTAGARGTPALAIVPAGLSLARGHSPVYTGGSLYTISGVHQPMDKD